MFIMDVDGTLTDGSIYLGDNGELMKRFDVKDGFAIRKMLPSMNIIPAIITGRESQIVQNRCLELGINIVIQNCQEKYIELIKISEEYNVRLSEIAYMGDDLNDFECINAVGFSACPADAVKEVIERVDYVSTCNGGMGAVRDVVNYIQEERKLKY